MKTSAKIDLITKRIRAAFAAADATKMLATEHSLKQVDSPAGKIAFAINQDRLAKSAPRAVSDIKNTLKSAIRKERDELKQIERDGMTALEIASYITGKTSELPDGIDPTIKSAAIALRGQPEAQMVARQLELAASNVHREIKRLSENYWLKTWAAVTVAYSNAAYSIYKAAGLKDETKRAERMLIRAKALNDGVRHKILNSRIGASS